MQITIRTDADQPLETLTPEFFSIDQTLAMHKSIGEKGWSVTHVPTGLAVLPSIRRKEDAEKLLDSLDSRFGARFRNLDTEDRNAMRELRIELTPLVRETPTYSRRSYWDAPSVPIR